MKIILCCFLPVFFSIHIIAGVDEFIEEENSTPGYIPDTKTQESLVSYGDITTIAEIVTNKYYENHEEASKSNRSIAFSKFNVHLDFPEQLLEFIEEKIKPIKCSVFNCFNFNKSYEELPLSNAYKLNPLVLVLLLHFRFTGEIPLVEHEEQKRFGFKNDVLLAKAIYEMGIQLETTNYSDIELDKVLLENLIKKNNFKRVQEAFKHELKNFGSLQANNVMLAQEKIHEDKVNNEYRALAQSIYESLKTNLQLQAKVIRTHRGFSEKGREFKRIWNMVSEIKPKETDAIKVEVKIDELMGDTYSLEDYYSYPANFELPTKENYNHFQIEIEYKN